MQPLLKLLSKNFACIILLGFLAFVYAEGGLEVLIKDWRFAAELAMENVPLPVIQHSLGH